MRTYANHGTGSPDYAGDVVEAPWSATPQGSSLGSVVGAPRRYGMCVALVTVAAGLAGFVFAARTDRGATATAYIEVAARPEAASDALTTDAMEELLESPEVRSGVAAELGTSAARLRPIVAFVPDDPGLVGVRVSGQNPRRVQKIATWAVAIAADLERQRTGVAPQAVAGGVQEGGLSPVRTALAGAAAGFVLALCGAYVVACTARVPGARGSSAGHIPIGSTVGRADAGTGR